MSVVALVAFTMFSLPAEDRGGQVRSDLPEDIINAFFEALREEKVDEAYDALVRDTIIAERRDDVEALKRSTRQAMDAYGDITGFEIIQQMRAGTSLTRFTCLSLNTDLPLRWRFYFYRTPQGWKLVDLRIDDGLVELFDDIATEDARRGRSD